MFSISTVWNIETRDYSVVAVNELMEMGFDGIELSWINEEKYKEIEDLKLKVSSVHNYLPEPMQVNKKRWRGDVFRLTALDEEERENAVEWTKNTIDTAVNFGAPAVVVHLGIPEGLSVRSSVLHELYNQGGLNTPEYVMMKKAIIKEREEKKDKFIEKGLMSLDEINSYAAKNGVKIGLETRMYYEELPGLEEFLMIFDKFKGGALYYWHDIGHAEIHQKMNFLDDASIYLKELEKYLIGIHIHDLLALSDHKAPGMGNLDFSKFVKYLKREDLIKVFEVHASSTKEELLKGKKMLEDLCSIK